MWILLSAVATASFLGSMHCVGMCGPLALWAGGAAEQRRRSEQAFASTTYHVGRLLTYSVVGFVAGYLGSLADWGGRAMGMQMVAARIAGVAMIAAGLYQLNNYAKMRGYSVGQLWKRKKQVVKSVMSANATASSPAKPGLITGLLIRFRPIIFRQPIAIRGLLTGMLTVLLPCGWLYIFALAAAGSGSAIQGALLMAAFWLGSVPALVGLVAGSAWFSKQVRPLVPILGSLVLLVGGSYTALGRGFADLSVLSKLQPVRLQMVGVEEAGVNGGAEGAVAKSDHSLVRDRLDQLTSTKLPCCEHCADKPEESSSRASAESTIGEGAQR